MTDVSSILKIALGLVVSGDAELYRIIGLSLRVTLTAVAIGCLVGIPLGAALVVFRFPGRNAAIALLNAFMGLPPVVVGLAVYLTLSRAGPLGVFGLLYTPTAMIIAQAVLVTPLIAALSRQTLQGLAEEYDELFRSLRVSRLRQVAALIYDGRYGLSTAALAGFGRAVAEVGAVIVVGGNIEHVTRVMTTAIALETSKGDLALALALGFILMLIAIVVNASVVGVNNVARSRAYA